MSSRDAETRRKTGRPSKRSVQYGPLISDSVLYWPQESCCVGNPREGIAGCGIKIVRWTIFREPDTKLTVCAACAGAHLTTREAA